jgi:glycosyltransferase involved in cell wall biosynthesis
MNEALFFTTHRMPVAVAAAKLGYEVHVAAPYEEGPVAKIKAQGFAYHDIPLHRGGLNPVAELRLLLHLYGLVRRLRPALVHHVAMKPVAYGGLVSRLLRVPAAIHAVTGLGYLFTREDLKARLIRGFILRLYRFALAHRNCRAIFQNPDDLKLFTDRGLVDPAIVVMIKGCGCDVNVFVPKPPPDGPVTVMFPARILGDKGVNEFIAAVRILKAEGTPARFVLVGRRDPLNPTDVPETTIRGWEREGLVEWWGFRTDMPDVLTAAHIICMPSYREGLPRGLIEAASCGLPIVTADVPGCREVVRHDDNGLLVPVRDGKSTADALRRLIADADRRARMGRRSRERAVDEFSEAKFVADTLAAYAQVHRP